MQHFFWNALASCFSSTVRSVWWRSWRACATAAASSATGCWRSTRTFSKLGGSRGVSLPMQMFSGSPWVASNLVLRRLFHFGECGKLVFSCVVSCSNAGKQNTLIFINGSALKPSKCAVQKEHLDLTAMVRKSMSTVVLLFAQYSLKVN